MSDMKDMLRAKDIGAPGNGGQFVGVTHAEAPIVLTFTGPLAYDPDGDYFDNLDAAQDPAQSTSVLEQIADTETDDDFKLAVASHRHASATAISKALAHAGPQIMAAALANPNTSIEDVAAIHATATRNAEAALEAVYRHGLKPGLLPLQMRADENGELAAVAAGILASAGLAA